MIISIAKLASLLHVAAAAISTDSSGGYGIRGAISNNNNINNNHRHLQNCDTAAKRKDCIKISGCTWEGACVAIPTTPAPITPAPVTPAPVPNPTRNPTDAPVSLAPVTSQPSIAGAGYCSNDVNTQCLTDLECGCGASRRRRLAKPACDDGTNRLTCADCSCEDSECAGDPSCPSTTSNPTVSPSAPPTGVELTPGPSGSPVTSLPTTSQPTDAPTRCECIGAATTQPTDAPVTAAPVTNSPVTDAPSKSPSLNPVTSSPITSEPTVSPSQSPETSSPSKSPSLSPVTSSPTTSEPTASPSQSPESSSPSKPPSLSPVTSSPTTSEPTVSPSLSPETSSPSKTPSLSPVTSSPTTSDPTVSPSQSPETSSPSKTPSVSPQTDTPTNKEATPEPSSKSPSQSPSKSPTNAPVTPAPITQAPSKAPTDQPTDSPITQAPSKAPITSSPTTPSPSASPTTSSPTFPPQQGTYVLACSSTGSICAGQTINRDAAELHEVRCCADSNLGAGWFQYSGRGAICQNVWGESEINGVCENGVTYQQALSMCASMGARVCTSEELLADCTRGSGCGHDSDFIWSSTPFVSSAPSPGPTRSPLGPGETSAPTTKPPLPLLKLMGDEGLPPENFPLGICEGDCDNNADCQAGTICFQRAGSEPTPGCSGEENPTMNTEDICIVPCDVNEGYCFIYNKGNNLLPEGTGLYGKCEGDCDTNADCAGNLQCFQRDATESIPGCQNAGTSGWDYCYDINDKPPLPLLKLMGNNGSPIESFPLGICEGDCDNNAECQAGTICFLREGSEPTPGCSGEENPTMNTEDICIIPCDVNEGYCFLYNKGQNLLPLGTGLYGKCEGDCDTNADCAGSLQCFQRDATQTIPGCQNTGTSGWDYCYDINDVTANPTSSPTLPQPTASPTASIVPTRTSEPTPTLGPDTFLPGDLTVDCDNGKMMLSTGMGCRKIVSEGTNLFADGYVSATGMHLRADGAACLPSTNPSNPNGWYYVSNSERGSNNGGVGAIEFDSTGAVVGYEMLLTNVNRNCGGGVTWYGSWVSCEEFGSAGYCHEVSPGPNGIKCSDNQACRTEVVTVGGNYESMAYYKQPTNQYPNLITTADDNVNPWGTFPVGECEGDCDSDADCDGALICFQRTATQDVPGCFGKGISNRDYCTTVSSPLPVSPTPGYPDFVPRFYTTEDQPNGPLTRYTPPPGALTTGNIKDILRTPGGTWEYLVLNAPAAPTDPGTFGWSKNRADGEASATAYFRNGEGIDVKDNGHLTFISKVEKRMIQLDLTTETWTMDSTVSGLFAGQPDQIAAWVGEDSEFLFFAEDSSNNDIHGRNLIDGRYFTLVQGGNEGGNLPNGVGVGAETTGLAFSPNNMHLYVAFQGQDIYEFFRTDGKPFDGSVLDTKYHT